MSSTQALMELENVQQQRPSEYWKARVQDPLLMQSWPELALAFTAWSWMDLEPAAPSAPVWRALWDQALTWPIQDDMPYVEQALVGWSEYPVWSSVRSMKLIQAMEKAAPRDWSSLLLPKDLLPQRFAYHLLNAVCLHPDKFANVDMANTWKLVLHTPSLRTDLKEVLLVNLLRSPDESWATLMAANGGGAEPNTVPATWMEEFKMTFPHRTQWLVEFEALQKQLDMPSTNRHILGEQWHLLLNKRAWELQAKSYEMFDFSDGAPNFF